MGKNVKDKVDMAQLEVNINGFRSVQENNRQVHYFILEICCGIESWSVERRYSEFDVLQKALSQYSQAIPSLPPKTLWFQSMNASFLEKRAKGLDTFMKSLAKIPFARNSFDYIRFLDVLLHVEPNTSAVPRVVKTVADTNFGVNDFVYSPTEGLLLTVCEDVNLVSRLDAKLSSLPLPWESEPAAVVPLGSFNCWIYEKVTRRWLPRSTLFFEAQVTSLAWDPTRRYAYLGLETGRICAYFGNNGLSEFSLVREFEAHVGRVSALHYNPLTDTVVSVGRDSRLVVFSAATGSIVSEADLEELWAVSLQIDSKDNLAYIGTSTNKILVYDISFPKARKVHELHYHRGHVRSLFFDESRGLLISGSFDHTANIWTTIGGEPQRTQLAASLKEGPREKIKSVVLLSSINLAATGYDDGTISIWDLRTSQMLYVIVGHEKSIIKMVWLPTVNLLVTAARDGKVNFWLVGAPSPSPSISLSPGISPGINDEKVQENGVDDIVSAPLSSSSLSTASSTSALIKDNNDTIAVAPSPSPSPSPLPLKGEIESKHGGSGGGDDEEDDKEDDEEVPGNEQETQKEAVECDDSFQSKKEKSHSTTSASSSSSSTTVESITHSLDQTTI